MRNIPEVGTKGYYAIGTDVYPITVVKVSKTGAKIWVRTENFIGDKENGHDYFGQQKWIITENPKGRIESAHWSTTGDRYRINGCGYVGFTGWRARQDPSF